MAGQLFMVNPPKRRRRRTAAQRRATAKLVAFNRKRRRGGTKKRRRVRKNPLTAAQRLARYRRSHTVGHGKRTKSRRRASTVPSSRRKRKGSATMARRKGRKRTTARRRPSSRRRRTSARRRSGVQTLRRHSVYLTNPRRRRRVRRYRRNPGGLSFKALRQGVTDAGATLVGGAVARIATGFVPLPKDGIQGAAVGLGVALIVGMAASKFVRGDTARFITAGAMQVPVKSLITTFLPQAGAYLGDYDNVGAYAIGGGNGDMGNYLAPGMYGIPGDTDDVEIGVYE